MISNILGGLINSTSSIFRIMYVPNGNSFALFQVHWSKRMFEEENSDENSG
jgi:hypothetical protein